MGWGDLVMASRAGGRLESTVVLKIVKAEVETVVVPDFVVNYVWRESVALVGIHWQILPTTAI